jgi:PGF-pre-PGF domain-containing protein
VQINASDYAGNEMGYSWSFSIRRGGWVPTPTPTPAPLVATPEPLPANISIIIKKNVGPMKAGESKVVYFERSDIWEIEVKVRNAVSGFSLLIKQFIKKPDVPDPSGVPYRYLSIEAENITEEDIANATIRFKVNLSWIEENGIDKRTILLQRYDEVEKKWTPLPTEKIGEENRSLLYEALSPGFSIFTITGNIKVEVTPKEALPSPTIAETPTLLPPLGPLIVIPFLPPEVITAKPNLIALFLLIAGTLLALFFLYRIWK